MCLDGRYTEHGITGRHGFARERFRIPAGFLVTVPDGLGAAAVLTEPASVVAKAWEHIDRIGGRAFWRPRTALVTGAGPIGLLAALLAVQRGLDVSVLDRAEDGIKPELVRALGARYLTGRVGDLELRPDVVVECTGAPTVVSDAMTVLGRDGVMCLAGVPSPDAAAPLDAARLNRDLVEGNRVVFGTVNANRRHYELALTALGLADPNWLARLVTRRVPLRQAEQAFQESADDVKVVLDITT